MGTVYLGRDPELDRQVAIKVIRDPVHDQELLERFFREARAAAALRHPNIVTIYASGQHENQPFMAMEFVDGDSLVDIIRQRQAVALSDKLAYIEQICAGLHFAHRAGIVHRDIKPANLMVDPDGVIRILDFGIARVQGSGMTQDGAMMGSLNYMSPEQMLGRPVDHRSDIFAVGAVAYELLCYQQAFKGGLNDGLLQRLPNEDPPPLSELCEGLPPALERVVMRALQKAPDKRFPDLAEMRLAVIEVQRRLDSEADQQTILLQPRPGPRPSSSRAHGLGRPAAGADAQIVEPGVSILRGPEQFGDTMTRGGTPAPRTQMPKPGTQLKQPGTRIRQPGTQVRRPEPIPQTLASRLPGAGRTVSRVRLVVLATAAALAIATGVAVPWLTSRGDGSGGSPNDAAAAAGGSGTVDPQGLLERATTLYADGELREALDLLARSPTAVATDSRLGDMAVRIAGASFDAMESAEKTAGARNAGELARNRLRAATEAKGRAESARQRGAYVEAAGLALAARDAYQQAAADALAQSQPTPAPAAGR